MPSPQMWSRRRSTWAKNGSLYVDMPRLGTCWTRSCELPVVGGEEPPRCVLAEKEPAPWGRRVPVRLGAAPSSTGPKSLARIGRRFKAAPTRGLMFEGVLNRAHPKIHFTAFTAPHTPAAAVPIQLTTLAAVVIDATLSTISVARATE